MGSFNLVCPVSHQVISGDDPVLVFPVVRVHGYRPVELVNSDGTITKQYSWHGSTCHSDTAWRIFSKPVAAEYYDYGRVRVQDWEAARRLLQHIAEEAYKVLPGENSCHDIPFDPSNFGDTDEDKWDNMWEVGAHESRLFIKTIFSDVACEVGFAVVHQDAYDVLIAEYELHKDYSGLSRARVDRVEVAFAEYPYATVTAGEFRLFSIYAIERALFGSTGNHHFAGSAGPVMDIISKLPPDEAKAWCVKQLEVIDFASMLDELNIHFHPSMYGGQDYANESGNLYASLIQTISESVGYRLDARYQEDEGD